jgi:hypothetical protein
MPLDIDGLAPVARGRYLILGSRYKSSQTIAQANKTLMGCSRHGPDLVEFGFGADDEQTLSEAREQLIAQEADGVLAGSARRDVSETYTDACKQGRHARLRGRTLLANAVFKLLDAGDEDTGRTVRTVLHETRSARNEADLPAQLKALGTAMQLPPVATVLTTRGGPTTLLRLGAAEQTLAAALRDRAAQSPVTASSERRDILDGLIVTLTRAAYAAARLAARARKQPSIAAEFRLTHLEPSRGSGTPTTDAPDTDPAGAAPPAAGNPDQPDDATPV